MLSHRAGLNACSLLSFEAGVDPNQHDPYPRGESLPHRDRRPGGEAWARPTARNLNRRCHPMSTITAMPPPIPAAESLWVPSPLYQMTVEQYEALVNSGAFKDRDRFHLINGYLVAKMTQNDPHCTADDLCGEALGRTSRPAGTSGRPSRSASPARRASPSPIAVWCGGRYAITAGARPGRPTWRSSWRSPSRAWRKTARWRRRSTGPQDPRLLDRQPGRPPRRGLHGSASGRLCVVCGLRSRTGHPRRDRRPADRCHRRRGHPALRAAVAGPHRG